MANSFNSTTPSFDEENVTATVTVTTDLPDVHPYAVMVSMACIWLVVTILGLVGNTMVILSAILSEHVRTMTNVLVLNLSVADLWTSLSLPWTSVALISNGDWPLASELPCQVAAFMWHTGLGTSLYNLALIAVNRLVRITRPRSTYNWLFTPRKMAFIVLMSWLVPFFVIIFPLTIGVGALGHDLKHDSCTDEELHPRADDYNLAQTIGFYPIPMATVFISYLVIYIYIRRHFRRQMHQKSTASANPTEQSDTSTTPMSSPPGPAKAPHQGEDRRRQVISRQQLQITKNLFWVCCSFILCISPYFISLFIPTSEKFTLYGSTILIFNSCVNPIIYAAKHPQFKMVLRPMLRCRWEEIPQPSKTLKAILARRH